MNTLLNYNNIHQLSNCEVQQDPSARTKGILFSSKIQQIEILLDLVVVSIKQKICCYC